MAVVRDIDCCYLISRWSARVEDNVPSPITRVRGAQLDR